MPMYGFVFVYLMVLLLGCLESLVGGCVLVYAGRERRSRLCVVVGGIMMAGGIGLPACFLMRNWRGAEAVYETALDGPPARSVKILDAEDGGISGSTYWVHFKISARDLDGVLARKAYQPYGSPELNFASGAPRWWKPEALGRGVRIYQHLFQADEDSSETRYLVVSPEGDEVYAAYFFN